MAQAGKAVIEPFETMTVQWVPLQWYAISRGVVVDSSLAYRPALWIFAPGISTGAAEILRSVIVV